MKIDQPRLFEIIGILAVVVSLVFVTIELRNNTNAINSQTNQGLAELHSDLMIATMENPELADLWVRGNGDPESLTEVELFRYRRIKDNLFNMWEQAFSSYTNGTLTDELWRGWNNIVTNICNKGNQYYWEQIGDGYGVEFTAHVNEMIDDNC